jgi:molybdopterin synthase catalytic subunit
VAVPLTLTVRLFGRYRDLAPGPSLSVDLPADARVSDLVRTLHGLPLGAPLPDRPVVAVNHRPAPDDHPLAEGDEIALIPPVAGG